MKRFCLTLDLKNDPQMIQEYKKYHEKISADIKESIFASGILNMQIYLVGNRMFMIMETADDFSFERKASLDQTNPKVQVWEKLMWKYQQQLPWSKPGEKWILMEKMFDLLEQPE
jgi:L-rhamnose mutarotase